MSGFGSSFFGGVVFGGVVTAALPPSVVLTIISPASALRITPGGCMTWHVDDLEPPLDLTAAAGAGSTPTAVDLTGRLCMVHILRPDGTVITRSVVPADQAAAPGRLSMPWQTGDLNKAGTYRAEVQVGTARPRTFGPVTFVVEPQIA